MIYINKHKAYNNPIPEDYEELYSGNLFTDTKADNINYLNPYINEATGLYYIWKNKKDKYVGLCHYKMFFKNNGEPLKLKDAKKILEDYDIIIKYDYIFDKGIYKQLRSEFENPDILDKYYNILCDKEPELKEWFELKQFNNSEMFVCKRETMNKYCEWLFPLIIPITEQFIREDADIVVNKRMIGHLVERLFSYWVYKNKLKSYRMEYLDI